MKKQVKNKYKIITGILTLCLLILSAGTDACFAEPITGSGVIPFKQVLVKFCLTMGSVLLSVLVIWIGLNFVKKISPQQFSGKQEKDLPVESLETPHNIEDAIVSFIDKNRL